MLTKKQSDEVAKTLRSERPMAISHSTKESYLAARANWLQVVFKMADACKKSNQCFNTEKFYQTCGVGSGE